MSKVWKFVISFVVTFAAAGIGSLFTSSQITGWYQTINKVSFNPPNYLFGPVWTILYILMAIALYLVWAKNAENSKPAYFAFGIQLALNALWSIIFFNAHLLGLAFFELVILWIFILINIVLFYRLNRVAGYLLLPYISWVTFAGILNFATWRIN